MSDLEHPHVHTLHRRGYPNQGGGDFCILHLLPAAAFATGDVFGIYITVILQMVGLDE